MKGELLTLVCTFHLCIFLLFTGCILHVNGDVITLGYLTADTSDGFVKNKQGRIISGAMSFAVEKINRNQSLLRGHKLEFMWADTKADTLEGTKQLTKLWKRGAVAFFGPEDSCDVEARVAAAWNLPMISYKCADHKVSNKDLYPTFARTFPPSTQVTRSIVALLRHYNWNKFTIVIGSSGKWQSIAEKLEELAFKNNMSLNGKYHFDEPHDVITKGNPFPSIVAKSYIDTRVYVFLGEHNGMVDMMRNLDDRGLLDTGEYILIYVDPFTYDDLDPLRYFRRTHDAPNTVRNQQASQSLLVVVFSPANNPKYHEFHRAVNYYNERPPFNFPNPFQIAKKISVYAAYLYDAVFLYANALDRHLKRNGSVTNGKAIIQEILGHSYQSIQGFLSYIDENGDADANYTVLSRTPLMSEYSNFSMLPVGHFQIGTELKDLPEFRLLDGKHIDWVRGEPPLDEPPCGYRGIKCIPPPNYTMEIVLGVLGGILFIVILVILIIYRNWRYEQEIAGLLWKINLEDMQGLHRDYPLKGSRVTLTTQGSFDSRMSLAQVFTKTGNYKGQLCALKKFTKKNLDISRSMKKEMKIMKDLRSDNVNAFIGACVDPPNFIVVTEYCSKGSLQDILENDDITLDSMFIASLIMDLMKGMIFIHDSELHSHGNLKSSNCVVNSRWTLQVADFGLFELRMSDDEYSENEHALYRNKLWTSPELLRCSSQPRRGTQKGDVYAFAIILYEILGRAGPYGDTKLSPQEIVSRVKCPKINLDGTEEIVRPDVSILDCQDYVISCMQDCWHDIPEVRPDFRGIRTRLKRMRQGMKSNIFDNMIEMMEKYQGHLEDLVAERTDALVDEKKKTENLLHRMLPKYIADQLMDGRPVVPETFPATTIYFSDICGFTALSALSTPMQVVDLLNDLYTLFDSVIRNYDVYKVETIGDAYMVVSGLPIRNGDNHAGEIASMSLCLLTHIKNFKIRHIPNDTIKLRIGIHTGSCVAGVVGLTMPRYCLFGDTVNTASRMESNGEALKIHVSPDTSQVLVKLGGYNLEERGKVKMKGKGEIFTYWLISEDESVRQTRISKNNSDLVSEKEPPVCTPPEQRKPCSKESHLNNSCSDVQNASPRAKRRSYKEKKLSPEGNFFELLRDSDSAVSRCNSVRSSFRRRRSLDSRPRSKEFNKQEVMNVNGCLYNRQNSTDSPNEGAKYPSARELQRLPSIVVDNPNIDTDASETDRLLDSGIPSDRSINNTNTDQTYPNVTQELVPLHNNPVAVCDGKAVLLQDTPVSDSVV